MKNSSAQTFVLVLGILVIIFGSTGLLFSLSGLALTSYWDSTLPVDSGVSWIFYYIFAVFITGFRVFIGIMAVTQRKKPEKASMLRTFGIIFVAITLLDLILVHTIFSTSSHVVDSSFAIGFSIGSTIGMFIMPILYTIAAQALVNSIETS